MHSTIIYIPEAYDIKHIHTHVAPLTSVEKRTSGKLSFTEA